MKSINKHTLMTRRNKEVNIIHYRNLVDFFFENEIVQIITMRKGSGSLFLWLKIINWLKFAGATNFDPLTPWKPEDICTRTHAWLLCDLHEFCYKLLPTIATMILWKLQTVKSYILKFLKAIKRNIIMLLSITFNFLRC